MRKTQMRKVGWKIRLTSIWYSGTDAVSQFDTLSCVTTLLVIEKS